MIPKMIDTHMRDALRDAIRILFPIGVDPDQIIARHVWRTRKVLGEVEGKIVSWQGWSASPQKINLSYRTIYIDYVLNILSQDERVRLFGEEFAASIDDIDAFIAFFITNFTPDQTQLIKDAGFIVRHVGPSRHACKVVTPNRFMEQSSFFWAAYLVQLANLKICSISIKEQKKVKPFNSSKAMRRNGRGWDDLLLLDDIECTESD